MVSDIHALIHGFLQQRNIVWLAGAEDAAAEARFTKAGVVPFVRDDPRRYFLMKPKSTIPTLGEAPFQLCKGTRMQRVPGIGWRDIRQNKERTEESETLVTTALREGIEELGLMLENIVGLYEMGPYGFSSATTGQGKEMWLFAAELRDDSGVLPDRDVAHSTAGRVWMDVAEFTETGRVDHRAILKDIDEKLARALKE